MNANPNFMNCGPTQTPDTDVEALRVRYEAERLKRHRAEGFAQYIEARGEYEEFFEFDPYTKLPPREPVNDEIDVVVLGGGFAGLIAAGRLVEAGITNVRIIDRGGDTVEPSAEAEAAWVAHVRETFYYDAGFWAACTPGYNNNEGLAASRYTIFGDMYGPGYNAFDDLIREWRDEGSLAGMQMVREGQNERV